MSAGGDAAELAGEELAAEAEAYLLGSRFAGELTAFIAEHVGELLDYARAHGSTQVHEIGQAVAGILRVAADALEQDAGG